MSRIAVVLPLRRGARARAEELLEEGPPADPEAAGLESHEVLVTDDEVVFLFEAPDQHLLDRLVAEASARIVAGTWKDLVAAAPRVAATAYTWRRAGPEENLSWASTPGPGDSEGGDVFAP
jgi:hypothetical protein